MRCRITVLGVVQGVGFRPYVACLAQKLQLAGYVCNSGGVVRIEACGTGEAMDELIHRLRFCTLPAAKVEQVTVEELEAEASETETPDGKEICGKPAAGFSIVESEAQNEADVPLIPADLPTCEDCLKEMDDPRNRRYRYPFISCVSCGPRYSILEAVPYDREHITMREYSMCPSCREEYEKMGDRRQHAQTISCRECGPQLLFAGKAEALKGAAAAADAEALSAAVCLLREGGILAVKGIGGYQLACRPDREESVQRLRRLKGRKKKPFAVMFPDLETVRSYCLVSKEEETLLRSPARPIVLLSEKRGMEGKELGEVFCKSLSSESRFLGAFLPCTGLHALLTREAGPLVVTSANMTDEPVFTRESQLEELWKKQPGLLDGAAWNTRRIVTPLDDSLVRLTAGRVQLLRRSRGYVPSPVLLQKDMPVPVLAWGGDLKAAFCLGVGKRAYLSQYYGDMEGYRVYLEFMKSIGHLEQLLGIHPRAVVCDLHPGYVTSQEAEKNAERLKIPLFRVQHHHAHAASVMAEHGLERCLAVIFDGTGFGTDGQVWGGEFFLCEGCHFQRMGHLSRIRLCGADAAAKDACLTAACHLEACNLIAEEEKGEAEIAARQSYARKALKLGINTEQSTSMGRLFDAVSALLGIRGRNSYEGECPIALENAAAKATAKATDTLELDFPVREDEGLLTADRQALVRQLWSKRKAWQGEPEAFTRAAALGFHEAVSRMICKICLKLREKTGETRVALGGGVFANVILLEKTIQLLEREGFAVYVNEQVPGNDGGISLGQAWVAAGLLGERMEGRQP